MGSQRERGLYQNPERERELYQKRKNENEKWVPRERERESFIRKERESCIEKNENARIIKGLVEEIIKKSRKLII